MQEISKGIKIIGLSLYLEREKILVLGDLHIGLEETLNKQGLLVPRFQIKDILRQIEGINKQAEYDKVIINGDLKHEFGLISKQEWQDVLKILDVFGKKKIILIKGNHDTILKPIASKKNLEIADSYKTSNILFIHGHKLPTKKQIEDIDVIIIAHEHPAITFPERPNEKFKCFLKGRYENKTLIVMPSFNFITEGSDVTKEQILSPVLQRARNIEVYVIADSKNTANALKGAADTPDAADAWEEIYSFGKLKNLNNLK